MTMSLQPPDDPHPPVDQVGHVAGAEPLAVERLLVVFGIGVTEKCVRAHGCSTRSASADRSDPHLDVGAAATPSSAWRTSRDSVRRPDVLTGTSDDP